MAHIFDLIKYREHGERNPCHIITFFEYLYLKIIKGIICGYITPLYMGNLLKGTSTNSKDLDEMQHKAAFHQGLHCL